MLADRTAPPKQSGFDCSVRHLLDTLPTPEAEALGRMLADPAWGHEALWRACTDEGYTIGRQSVGRHRRGECRCRHDAPTLTR